MTQALFDLDLLDLAAAYIGEPKATPRKKPKPPEGAPASPIGAGRWFDVVIGNDSGGKDSQVLIEKLVEWADAEGVLDRVVLQHNDLGPRVEHVGTLELVKMQADRYRLPVLVRSRDGVDLLEDVRTRRKRDGTPRGWPGPGLRYCTGEHKTAVGRKLMTELVTPIRPALGRPVRILEAFGFRAAESKKRAEKAVFGFNAASSTFTTRSVFTWLPIHGMSTQQVWESIRDSGVPYHPAYDEGMSRLSCRFCVLASARDLSIAKRMYPETAAEYEAVEAEIDHDFQNGRPLRSIAAQPGRAGFAVKVMHCPACRVPVLARTTARERYCPRHAATGPWDRDWAADVEEGPSCGADLGGVLL